jgi:hypothetical protein
MIAIFTKLHYSKVHYKRIIYKGIEEGDKIAVQTVLRNADSSLVLQILLTAFIPNHDNRFYHDSEVLQDAHELLGNSFMFY